MKRMVGAALKKARPKVIISSKSQGQTKQEVLADLDTSLRELGTDYVDIWYLHMKNQPEQVTEDLLEAQRLAKQNGKIRFAGVSTHFNTAQPGLPTGSKSRPDSAAQRSCLHEGCLVR